ncbi:hypothetical protein TUZN_2221 [Thermoproteus uzoniensis 768-20]|uniref:Uncharacterized protein n=1 Tax=Thermoproteus uzoniensis (strain 768-20) TaxID=999630 RepID=F2L660_THEU7|nr:hypothetical protein [Thermoproteus uzoniensis]AEA13676.1 hypothetical protein TUZN_2221 [Thermoproteus uzoniensis 768-20]
MLQAARPDGPRDVDVARFALVADRVDWTERGGWPRSSASRIN